MKNIKSINRSIDFKDSEIEIKFNETFLIAGVIEDITFLQTKKTKEKWATMIVRDFWGTIDVMVFSKVFSGAESILRKGGKSAPILISGYANTDNDDQLKIIAQKIEILEELFAEFTGIE